MSKEAENIIYMPLEGTYDKIEGQENSGTFLWYTSREVARRNHPNAEIIHITVVGWELNKDYTYIVGSI
jgi:hypothetical protein